MKLVFVHGRGQTGKDPDELREQWAQVLRDGLAEIDRELPRDVEIVFPFYGDVLAEHVRRSRLPAPQKVASMGAGENDAYEQFVAQTLVEIQQGDERLTEELVREQLDEDVGSMGPQNWRWVQAIARTIDRFLPTTTDLTIQRFLEDVFVYSMRRSAHRDVDRIVADAIGDGPAVVVAHSLGSVVAYNVLWSRRVQPLAFVTVGSPLGIRSISSKIEQPVRNLAVGGRWTNAYDPADIVSLHPLVARHFPVSPGIDNHEVHNETDNRHGIDGYLGDRVVGRAIIAALDGAT